MRRTDRPRAAPRSSLPSRLLALALCLIQAFFLAVFLDTTEETPRESAAISSTARTVAAPSLAQRLPAIGAQLAASSAVRVHAPFDAWIAPVCGPIGTRRLRDQRDQIRVVRPQTHIPRMSSGDPLRA